MHRRTLLAATTGALATSTLAGCVTGENGTDATTGGRTRPGTSTTGTAREPPWDGAEPTTASFPQTLESDPEPSKYVRFGNEGADGASHDVAVEVYQQAASAVVHDRSHAVDAGAERTVYDTADANPTASTPST